MDSNTCTLITKEDLKVAYDVVQQSFLCVRTPTIHHCQQAFGIEAKIDLHLKLESSQTTGSFKVRGLANQLENLPEVVSKGRHVITMSAGNYGKALSYAANKLCIPVTVVMPKTAPDNREVLMRSYGSKVEMVDVSELQSKVDELVAKEGMHFCHPFDDLHLIAGHGSLGLEILEDIPNPDIVLVCCGGGGLLAGTAAAIKLHCQSCRVYGVEPETASTMYQSREKGVAVTDHSSHSIAAGLSPPYAGEICFAHNTAFVDKILLVTDSEIISAVKHLYNAGLKVQPSGAAAFAALMHHRVPGVSGKKVVVVITASTMYQSREKGVAVTDHSSHSIAAGLSPPYAGEICFAHNTAFVDKILLVTDSEIISAVKHLYNAGLKVQPSGAAAFAALMHHRVPDVSGKKVVVVITASTMYQSREKGVAVTDHSSHSIAAGLSPPYAGEICFAHNTAFVDKILLVTDSEIISAVKHLYNAGLKVQPSGAAAFAALMHHRVPDVSGKKVVVVITGGNVSPAELVDIFELS